MREFFSALYGNEKSKARLGNAIIEDRLPHAFLINGLEGSGKKTLAQQIAMALNCELRDSKEVPLPCNRCNTCRRIREGNFTDIMRVRRSGEKATIGVDDIRLFRDDMFLSPTESTYKIYIIEEADRLTVNAQNALLTVLEEPPKNVIIILLCESSDKILTTIKSRAQSIPMQRFEFEELKKATFAICENAKRYSDMNPALADGLIMSSDGRIGRAISLFSEKESKENNEDRNVIIRIINSLRSGAPYKELYGAISELPTSRSELVFALEALMCAIRDVTLSKFDRNISLTFYTSRDEAQAAAKEMNTKRLLSVYEAVKNALEDTEKNVGIAAVVADLAAKIKLL